MADLNIEDEIREIRAHLDRLQQQRDAEEAFGGMPESASESAAEEVNAGAQATTSGVPSDVDGLLDALQSNEWVASASTHAKEWLSALNEDLKDTKPTTLLAIFGLGVMVGRLTSK